jgi:predicted PurR-regulated permease PerM
MLQPTHELHKRRFGRNLGVALTLVAFILLMFALTYVKITRGAATQGFGDTIQRELGEGASE